MRRLKLVLTGILFLLAAAPAAAQERYDILAAPFDAGDLTTAEKRFLQAGLAFEGVYAGLLDGEWGDMSQRALEDFTRREFDAPPVWALVALLSLKLLDTLEREGWSVEYSADLGLSFLVPTRTLRELPPSKHFENLTHEASSLSYALGKTPDWRMTEFHDYTAGQHAARERLYTVREPRRWVTVATRADGTVVYARSDKVAGGWSTVILSADAPDRPVLQAVAGSITTGRAPGLGLPEDGRLGQVIELAIAILEEDDGRAGPGTAPAGRAPDAPAPPSRASGTGFYVSTEGHVLTNAHVVEECGRIEVNGRRTRRAARSDAFDLALLRVDRATGTPAARFSARPARLNSDVTVVGYPLSGLLAGLNVTRGAVSSTRGLRGDETTMQITAPVQPGNSGGPVLSKSGAVVGVVVGKLDALDIADVTGDIPQNVNFAIRGEIAKLFLSDNGVEPLLPKDGDPLAPEVLAERASAFTVHVECVD